MKRLYTLLATALLLVLISSCSKKSSNPSDNDPTQRELQKIDSLMTTQADLDTTLQELILHMDSTAAKDSVVKILRADPNVQTAQSSSQGITIQYTNGMRGGILLDPEDDWDQASNISRPKLGTVLDGELSLGHKPSSKKTIFLNPSYWERQPWADPLTATADAAFAKTGYNAFEKYYNAQCTIDKFTSLSGYGIVHIYTHGIAWPSKNNIQEVFLLTGETASQATTNKYFSDVKAGKVPIVVYNGSNKYCISPSFFARHNNFSDDTTLVYCGFCYSFCGGWQDTLIYVAKAGACVGFDWHVLTNWNAAWGRHLYTHMCDTSKVPPMTLAEWRSADPDTDNTYFDNEPQCQKWVSVWNRGYSDLVLWSAVRIASITPDSGAVDIPLTIRGSGFGYFQGTSTVTISGLVAEIASWSDTLIATRVPFEATSGNVVVTVGGQPSNSVYFRVTNPFHTLVPLTSQHSMKIYGPNNQWEFEFVFDLAFSGSVEGPGLATVSDTNVLNWPYTEPMDRYKSYYGTVGGPSPADVTVRYSLQTTVNGQDASFSTPITLTKTYESGDYWEVTVTPIYITGQWKDSDSQYPLVQVAEATPIVRPVAIGDRSHLIIDRRFNIHAVFHHHVGIDYPDDYSPEYNIVGFTFEHR